MARFNKMKRYSRSYFLQSYNHEWDKPFWPPFWHMARELFAGYSISRTGMRWLFRQWRDEIRGVVVEAPCGKESSRVPLPDRQIDMYVGVDINKEFNPTVVADIEKGFPLKDDFADTVIMANSLYLFREPQKILEDVRRVLKPGGTIMLAVPLVWQYYPEPKDYWRFTGEGLEYVLEQAGFKDITIMPVGGRWTAAAVLVSPYLHPGRVMRPIINIFCAVLDRLSNRLFPFVDLSPISYCAKAKKI